MSNMLNSMNFNNLSVEGYTSFILALIFTIVCIASFLFFARHKKINKVLLIIMTIIIPFLAIFCWVYLIMNIYQFDLAMSLYISFGASAGYVLLSLCIGLIVSAIVKAKHKNKVEETQQVEEVETVPTETKIDETQTIVTPLLLTEEKQPQPANENLETVETETVVENIEEPANEETIVESEIAETEVSNEENVAENIEIQETEEISNETVEEQETNLEEVSKDVEETATENIENEEEIEEVKSVENENEVVVEETATENNEENENK